MKDNSDNSEYRLEFPVDGEWRLYRNNHEVALQAEPRMYRDGGTIQATLASNEVLDIPQQLFPQEEAQTPTLDGRPLELVEWWIGGKRYLNGVKL